MLTFRIKYQKEKGKSNSIYFFLDSWKCSESQGESKQRKEEMNPKSKQQKPHPPNNFLLMQQFFKTHFVCFRMKGSYDSSCRHLE